MDRSEGRLWRVGGGTLEAVRGDIAGMLRTYVSALVVLASDR